MHPALRIAAQVLIGVTGGFTLVKGLDYAEKRYHEWKLQKAAESTPAPKKNRKKAKVESTDAAPQVKPKNRKLTTEELEAKANAATTEATVSDKKPKAKGSLSEQLAAKIATGELKPVA